MLAALAVLTTLTWTDVPALVDSAGAAIDGELRACMAKQKLPWTIVFIMSRNPKTGATVVQMPFPNVGQRGFTPEETCLMKVIPKVALPELPAGIDRIDYLHTVVADGATAPAPEKAFDDWRDPAATIGKLDLKPLAACTKAKRVARVTIDLTHGKTRIWLPAWQFHSPGGDGSTPKPEQRVKACMTKAIASWKLPVLPKAMGQLDLSFALP